MRLSHIWKILPFFLLGFGLLTAVSPADSSFSLPSRPTAVPTATATAIPTAVVLTIMDGSQIELVVTAPIAGMWTAVQWQAGDGNWYRVDGWRGELGENGRQTWWVGEELLGRGPFRWQLFTEEGGQLLTTSDNFDLPQQNGQVTTIKILLAP